MSILKLLKFALDLDSNGDTGDIFVLTGSTSGSKSLNTVYMYLLQASLL